MTPPGASTILIVDDEELNIDVLCMHLEDDYRIVSALDGARALEILNGPELPDAILLDVSMPGMDGYEVCSRIKADPRIADIPVLFVTALEQDEALAFDVGAADYVPKPIIAEVVRGRLGTQLALRAASKRIGQLEKALASTDSMRLQLERRQERLMELTRERGAEVRALRARLAQVSERDAGLSRSDSDPSRIP